MEERGAWILVGLFLILSLVLFRWAGKHSGTSSVYQSLLVDGKEKRVCGVCNRRMNDKELLAFEKNVGHLTSSPFAKAIINAVLDQ
jgi:DNA repair protein RAD50